MFTLYRNDRKNHFPWQFEEIARGDFNELVGHLSSMAAEELDTGLAMLLEIDWTDNFAKLYTDRYIYVIQ